MFQDLSARMYTGKRSSLARNGIAVASVVALAMSGCDSNESGIAGQPGESNDLTDSPLSYREGGVVLSKRASDELADFVAATQFDAVFPISARLHAMPPHERAVFFKRLDAARREVDDAMQRVRNAGDAVSRDDVVHLDAARRNVENVMRSVLRADEKRRSRERARALIEKYPILAEMSREQIRDVLLKATGAVHKNRIETGSSYSVESDTSDGDECRLDCSVQYVIDFGVTEVVTGAALFGCVGTTIAILPCVGWALAAQWTMIASDTYSFYTCTKKCD